MCLLRGEGRGVEWGGLRGHQEPGHLDKAELDSVNTAVFTTRKGARVEIMAPNGRDSSSENG